MRVGFVGLGRMGMALLPRIRPAATVLTAWNRTPRAAPEGINLAPELSDLVRQSDAIFTMVADDMATLSVHEAMLSVSTPGQIFVEMGTVRLETVARLATMAEARGASFADVPVAGTVAPAQQGKLVALAGGDTQTLETIRPILESFSRRVVACGPVGSGMAMKHCINGLMGAYFAALAEALGAGVAAGLSVASMLDVVMDTPAALPALGMKLPVIQGDEGAPVAYSVGGVCKDMDVIVASGEKNGAVVNLMRSALQTFLHAADDGARDKDLAMVARTYSMPDR